MIGEGVRDLPEVVRNRIAYVALFGDPTWDNGPLGAACISGSPQWVRGSAPCFAGPGVLSKTRDPYVPTDIQERVGSWCRLLDGVCEGFFADLASAHFLGIHGKYFEEHAESESAAREAAAALSLFFPDRSSEFDVSWHDFVFGATGADLAIVFDTTGSMGGAIADARHRLRTSRSSGLASSRMVESGSSNIGTSTKVTRSRPAWISD